MTSHSEEASSIVRLNIGGKKFFTTMDTLTVREPQSMLAAMFSGRHKISMDSEGHFIDRDGKYFRHILNWLRGGALPKLSDAEISELMCEADYYQISGLVSELLHHQKKAQQMSADLTRSEVIKCLQSGQANFSCVNLSGLDLSKLNFANVKFTEACLKDVSFKRAYLMNADFRNFANVKFTEACLKDVSFKRAHLMNADFRGVVREEEMKRKILGSAFPLKQDFDRKILSRFQRPHGLIPSSMLGLESMTGALEDFGVEDYLQGAHDTETLLAPEMHHGMEVRVGLSKGPVQPSFM